jgi:hypothetical protein
MNLVMSVIKDMNLKPWGQKFEMDCNLNLKVRKSEEKYLLSAFRQESSVKLEVFPDE